MRRDLLLAAAVVVAAFNALHGAGGATFMEEKPHALSVRDCPSRFRMRPGNVERSRLFDRASCMITALLRGERVWDDTHYRTLYKNYQQQLARKLEKMHGSAERGGIEALALLAELMRDAADLASEEMLPAADLLQECHSYQSRILFLTAVTNVVKPAMGELQDLRGQKSLGVFPSPCPCHGEQAIVEPRRALQDVQAAPHTSHGMGMVAKAALAVAGGLLIDAIVRKERSLLWNGVRTGREAVVVFWRWITRQQAPAHRSEMPTYRESLELARELAVEGD